MVGVSPTVLVMQHGSAQLKAWQKRLEIDQRQAARILGLHYTSYNQLLTCRRLPGRQLAVEIETTTGVPVGAWTPTRVGKTKKRQYRQAKNTQYMQGANGR